jgi:type IV pilus assembly protein PilQ
MKPSTLMTKFASGLMLAAAATAVWAQNAIESLSVVQQGGNTVVNVQMKDALSGPPTGFSVANPPRIAVDFANTSNSLAKSSQEVNQGELRSVNVVQVGERSRLVLNLRNAASFDTKVDGKVVVITLAGSGAAPTAVPATAVFAPAPVAGSAPVASLRDVDFRRGPQGEGRVVVELGSANSGIDVRQQGQAVIVDFQKTRLPENLRKRLDVLDFGTPIQTINTFTQGDNVRMVIEPKGLWEHNAYQSDTQFVVEVKPVKEDPNKLVQGSRGGYQGERLSLNFQNIEVRSVLQVIADFTNLNIITSDSVGGNLTLRLKDVPWDQALDIILQTRGLDMRKNGNVVWIAPRDELATKEKLELEAKSAISDLEPLRSDVIQLNYVQAASVRTMLGGTQGSAASGQSTLLSKRGSASFDARSNQIFIQDSPSRLDEIRRFISKIDVPISQVLIEARIVEAVDTFSKNLGAKLGVNQPLLRGTQRDPVTGALVAADVPNLTRAAGTRGWNISGNNASSGWATGQVATIPNFASDQYLSNLGAQGIGGFNPGQIGLSLFSSKLNGFLNLELSALEADGKGKIISAPRVITTNNVEASIEQGTELPYQQATSSGATSVSFRKANLSLKATPQITPDGNVILKVEVNKDSVGQVTTAGFAIDTKAVKTQVLIENGGTVVLGGIYTQQERDTLTKVPLFGDLPVFGNLFKNNAKTNDKTELLIFLTPRIMNDRLTLR